MGSFTQLTYHIVFSTKYRQRSITEALRPRLYEYTGGIIRNLNGSLLGISGVEDHVHLLARLPPTHSVSEMIRDIKANSSKWANQQSSSQFEWQKGYGAFTVSYSQREMIGRYLQNQEEHHRRMSFEEKYEKILRRHGIEFDRRYLFEAEFHG